MYETTASYLFSFLDRMEVSAIGSVGVGVEKRDSAQYYFDTKTRSKSYLFQYTLGGSGTLEVDGRRYTLTDGQGFFIHMPREGRYYFDPERNEAPWHFIYIIFQGQGIKEYYDYVQSKVGSVMELSRDASSVRALTRIFDMANNSKIEDFFTGERLAFDFLCKLCKDCTPQITSYSDTVRKALQIIKDEFVTIGGIAEVADRLNITQYHFSRIFSGQMGMTPMEFLTRQRLEKAIDLLSRTQLPIEDVARQCGFSTGNYFCKVFRRYFGVSPLKYRKNSLAYSFDIIKR